MKEEPDFSHVIEFRQERRPFPTADTPMMQRFIVRDTNMPTQALSAIARGKQTRIESRFDEFRIILIGTFYLKKERRTEGREEKRKGLKMESDVWIR